MRRIHSIFLNFEIFNNFYFKVNFFLKSILKESEERLVKKAKNFCWCLTETKNKSLPVCPNLQTHFRYIFNSIHWKFNVMYAHQPDEMVLRILEWLSTFNLIIYITLIHICCLVVYFAMNIKRKVSLLTKRRISKRFSEHLPEFAQCLELLGRGDTYIPPVLRIFPICTSHGDNMLLNKRQELCRNRNVPFVLAVRRQINNFFISRFLPCNFLWKMIYNWALQ